MIQFSKETVVECAYDHLEAEKPHCDNILPMVLKCGKSSCHWEDCCSLHRHDDLEYYFLYWHVIAAAGSSLHQFDKDCYLYQTDLHQTKIRTSFQRFKSNEIKLNKNEELTSWFAPVHRTAPEKQTRRFLWEIEEDKKTKSLEKEAGACLWLGGA